MENAKQMLADIKGKLDELETELEQLEARGVGSSGDSSTEAQRHQLALQDVLTDLQQRIDCLLYTSPSPRDAHESRMPSSA